MRKKIERLDWDSNFFGYEVGKYLVENPEDFNLEELADELKRYKLVYVFCEKKIQSSSLKLVDEKATFLIEDLTQLTTPSSAFKFESFDEEKHAKDHLEALGIESAVHSRFKTDSNFRNQEYKKLYREWINNSITGDLAIDIPVVCKGVSTVVGFTTLNKRNIDLAEIGLVAVSKEMRGKGLATDLVKETLRRARNRGYKNVQVVTQMANIPARNLYTKTGFTLKNIVNIYHYWA